MTTLEAIDIRAHALFLDLDGTLVDIAETPSGVQVPADLVDTVSRLTDLLGGALAINTGRPIAEVDMLLAPLHPVAAGTHGAELRTAAGVTPRHTAPAIDARIIAAARRLRALSPGVVVEEKRSSVAIHYRLAPSLGPRIETEAAAILADGPDHLILSHGRKVVEIVPRHVDKGAALAALMQLPAFAGRRPVMIGDDFADEAAFRMARRLGGIAATVAGELFPAETADFASPRHVRDWLARHVRGPQA